LSPAFFESSAIDAIERRGARLNVPVRIRLPSRKGIDEPLRAGRFNDL
jgi:hypothetical protein